jgi:hypothetical protein
MPKKRPRNVIPLIGDNCLMIISKRRSADSNINLTITYIMLSSEYCKAAQNHTFALDTCIASTIIASVCIGII